jgi:hypothetical protein
MNPEHNVHQQREVERMQQYQEPNPYPAGPGLNRLVLTFFVGIILAAIAFMAARANADSAGDHWICQAAAIYSFAPGAMQAEWDNASQTWRVMDTNDPAIASDDVWLYWSGDEIEVGIMYANPDLNEAGPAYIDYLDATNSLLWRFAFIDLIPSEAAGRYGHHHSCEQGPIAIELEQYK